MTNRKHTLVVALFVCLLTSNQSIQAETPPCGSTILTVGTTLIFDSDMVCPSGFNGTALTILSDSVRVNGAGFRIVAPDASTMIVASLADGIIVENIVASGNIGDGVIAQNLTNSTISNINASGGAGTGIGIRVLGSGAAANFSGNLIANNTVHGRRFGILMDSTTIATETNNTYTGNNLSDNVNGLTSNRSVLRRFGNVYTNNDVSRSSNFGMGLSGGESPLTVTGNIFTDAANGLALSNMDSVTLSGLDFSSANIPGTVLDLTNLTNSTISNINASGGAGTGIGIRVLGSGAVANFSGNLIANNTVHGRRFGILMDSTTIASETNNTYTGNNLSDNDQGIVSSRLIIQRSDNVYTNNDVSGSSVIGFSLGAESGAIVRDNVGIDSDIGILLSFGAGNIVSGNDVSSAISRGIWLSGEHSPELKNNLIAAGSGDGLVLTSTTDVRIFNNNIFGNLGFQVTADPPVELSFGNQGNYWGRSCPGLLFLPGLDSNSSDVVDSFPFGFLDGWQNEMSPGCGPLPMGSVSGTVRDEGVGLADVLVILTDSGETIQAETITAANGTYELVNLQPGIYTATILVPLGYAAASPAEVDIIVNSNQDTISDFDLQRLLITVDTRSKGFWKHQVKVHLTGRGQAQESAEALLAYLEDIQGQYDIVDAVSGLEGIHAILDPPKPPTMREKAQQQLMALLLNLASLRIATYVVISLDDTAGEAIDFVIELLERPGNVDQELETAKDIAEDINRGLIPVDMELIPET